MEAYRRNRRKPMKRTLLTSLALLLLVGTAPLWAGDDKAPMPQTKGMQGMDPALHDQWAKDGKQDPYKDCKPNAAAAAQQAAHGMPDTKGMKGMDPKAHTVRSEEHT